MRSCEMDVQYSVLLTLPHHPCLGMDSRYCLSCLFIRHSSESRCFSELYTLAEHIGTGAFGSVSVAIDKQTGGRFAVKTIQVNTKVEAVW